MTNLSEALQLGLILQVTILNDLNPVIVRVKNESHSFHTTISESLLPIYLQIVKSLARCIEIINRDTWIRVSKATSNMGEKAYRYAQILEAHHCHYDT